jgi:hypothetical protein
MKLRYLFFGVLLLLTQSPLIAHAQKVLTVQPVFSEPDALLNDEVIGSWQLDLFGIDTLTFEKAGDNFYYLYFSSQNTMPQFEAVFTRISNLLLLDLSPVIPDSIIGALQNDNVIKAHSVVRVSTQGDTLHLALMNYSWFYNNLLQKKVHAADYTWSNNKLLLTGSTYELREFMSANALNGDFFQKDLILTRIPSEISPRQDDPEIESYSDSDEVNAPPACKPCTPQFPIKDGWLGADGSIAIPLGPMKTLWIFSDSFVGGKNMKSRMGSKMIANTVAIMNCTTSGESTIRYYWRSAYTKDPEPFFRTFTKRYKFWPQDAFLYADNLYVVLTKVGPKMGAAPDDLFNFKHLGLALAKIPNPGSAKPDQWDIQLYTWSNIFGAEEWAWSVIDGDYLYFLLKGESQRCSLARIPLEHVEFPESRVEHLAKEGEWKVDVPLHDRKTLFRGDGGNSVSYYEDVKKWVMVLGPGFLTNKIRLRTAPELFGPWSDEIIVYECPEQTVGSALYDADNFCYLGRAHSEFYDSESRTLLITYDWNVSNISKLLSSVVNYIPRVVRIRIPE